MKFSFFQGLLAASLLAHAAGDAAPLTTGPLGVTHTTLYGSAGGGSRKNNIIAPNLINGASWKGTVASASGDVLNLTGPAMVAGGFNAASITPVRRYTYYIHTNDGYWVHVVSNDAASVTLPAGMAVNFDSGEAVEIRRHLTVLDFFGTNAIGLKGSATGLTSEADLILINDTENGGSVVILASALGGGTWINAAQQNADNFPIYPDLAIQVSRISTGTLTLAFQGEVDTYGRQMAIRTGTNVRPVLLPVSVTLSDLDLYTGDTATGLAGSANGDLAEADSVQITINGETKVYFYSPANLGGGAGWYDESLVYAGNKVIPAGAGIVVRRKNPSNSAPFTWKSPAPEIQ